MMIQTFMRYPFLMLKATSRTAFGGQLPYNGSLSSNIHATSHEPQNYRLSEKSRPLSVA